MSQLIDKIDNLLESLLTKKNEAFEEENKEVRLRNEEYASHLLNSPESSLKHLTDASLFKAITITFSEMYHNDFQMPDASAFYIYLDILAQKYDFFSLKEKEAIFQVVQARLLKTETPKEFFQTVFLDNTFPFKDRLKSVTSVKDGLIISKETEDAVFSSYKKIYENCIYHSFCPESEKEKIVLQNIELILFIHSVKGTRFSEKNPATILNRLVFFSTDKVLQEKINLIIKNWYYENQFTFIHEPEQYHFDLLMPLISLLNKKERDIIISNLLIRFEENITKIEKSISKNKDYNESQYFKLISLKEKINTIESLQKS